MGRRGADREPATAADIAATCRLLEQALDQGALGIGTSRSLFHHASRGKAIPTCQAAPVELPAFAEVLHATGKGVFRIVEDIYVPGASLDAMCELARASGQWLTFSICTGNSGSYCHPPKNGIRLRNCFRSLIG